MFVAHFENTMRNAKFAPQAVKPVVRTIEQIRAEKRRQREVEARRQMEEEARRRIVAERNMAAVRTYRCIDIRGSVTPAKDIVRWVAEMKGVTVDDILGNRRERQFVTARFDAIKAVADARPDLSLSQIGKIFNRDHTTIIHALNKRGGRSKAA